MLPDRLFQIHLVLGYVAWLLCFGAYILPRLRSMDRVEAHRVIATLHSFRFLGLVFILPGVVGPNLPAGFASFAAYGDLATGLLAMLALFTVRVRGLFWLFVVAFNLVGAADIILDYYRAIQAGLPALAGQLASTYFIPVIYVPLLMITHILAFYWMAGAPAAQDGCSPYRRCNRSLVRLHQGTNLEILAGELLRRDRVWGIQ
jgi:hypothetical protein